MQANDLIRCGYFCIRFIDFMLQGNKLLDYTNLYLLMNLLMNVKKEKAILEYFQLLKTETYVLLLDSKKMVIKHE